MSPAWRVQQTFADLAAKGGTLDQLMIDAAHVKACDTSIHYLYRLDLKAFQCPLCPRVRNARFGGKVGEADIAATTQQVELTPHGFGFQSDQ